MTPGFGRPGTASYEYITIYIISMMSRSNSPLASSLPYGRTSQRRVRGMHEGYHDVEIYDNIKATIMVFLILKFVLYVS